MRDDDNGMVGFLRTVLDARLIRDLDDGGNVTLVERRKQGRWKVIIAGIEVPAVVVRFREKGGHSSWVREVRNVKKRCDHLIVADGREEYQAVLIELKRSLGNWKVGAEQLRRSRPLLQYFRSLYEAEEQSETVKRQSLNYVIIARKGSERFDKQRVKGGAFVRVMSYEGIRVGMFVGPGPIRWSCLRRRR